MLHSENAPASSLIQRAGRCARFAKQQGRVIVYPLPCDEEGKEVSTLPYDKELCGATWEALERFDGQQVGFREEQVLIDKVHTEQDEKLLADCKDEHGHILADIFKSLRCNERGVASTLIRDVQQVQILVHDHPKEAITEAPWLWQSFSMHPGSLSSPKRWQALLKRGKDLEWVCMEAIPVPETKVEPDGADGMDQRRKPAYTWQPVTNPAQITGALMIVLPRQLAHYDSELGFVLLDGQLDVAANDYQSSLLEELNKQNNKSFGSNMTSYEGHIEGLVRAYNRGIKEDLSFIAHYLEQALGLSAGIVDQAIRLALACHDLGKLDQRWQRWALEWQTKLYEKQVRPKFVLPYPGYCFAKTDNQRKYKEWQREVRARRPHHACESVAIGRSLIGHSLGISKTSGQEKLPLLRAICGAIAHHHSAQASEYGPVQLHTYALDAASKALRLAHQGGAWSYDPKKLTVIIEDAGDLASEAVSRPKLTIPTQDDGLPGELETWLYFLIVRALRLVDQRADQ